MSDTGTPNLFTASDVARFCQVDLKTIHNWADKGHIKHFRTPGRHLRFSRLDVLEFLRKCGYPIPGVFQQLDAPGAHGKPVVVFIEPDPKRHAEIVTNMSDRFQVRTYVDVNVGMVALGEAPADALVFDVWAARNIGAVTVIKTIAHFSRLANTRCILYGNLEDDSVVAAQAKYAMENGAYAFVKRGAWVELKDAILTALAAPQPTAS